MRRWLIVAAIVLAGCSAAAPTPPIVVVTAPPQPTPIIIYVTPAPKPSSHTITGTFELDTSWMPDPKGIICYGIGGYSDVAAGMQVVVKDQGGAIIANGVMGPDPAWQYPVDYCSLAFTVTAPDAPFYTIEVGHRGSLTFSNAQLAAKGWSVSFKL